MATATFTMRMDSELKQRLEAEADREDRSASWLAARAIEILLDERAAKYAAIDRALAELPTANMIDESVVTKWVESWGTADELPPPRPSGNGN